MLVEVKDLKEGDEILIGAGGKLKYLRLTRDPVKTGTTNRITLKELYKSVRCSIAVDAVTTTYYGKNYTKRTPICTPENHNHIVYENLNYKTIWLVKRKKQN